MIIAQLKASLKQKDWRWPAVANFVLGGTGAGFYLVVFWLYFSGAEQASFGERLPFGLISSLLIICGFLCLSIEAGRPLRGWYLFRHLRQSWISRETVIGCLFVLTALGNCFFPHPVLKLIAGISALGFLISQGCIVYHARAIAAWNVPIIPLVFLSSGLVAGYGLFLILITSNAAAPRQTIFVLGFIFLLFNLVIWLFYLWKSQTANFPAATKVLRQPIILILTIGLSQIIPLLLLLFLLMQSQKIGVQPVSESLIMALSGVLLLIGNIGQKAGIIVAAGYFRGIELRG